jgi:hypothetical protein
MSKLVKTHSHYQRAIWHAAPSTMYTARTETSTVVHVLCSDGHIRPTEPSRVHPEDEINATTCGEGR